MTGDCCVSCKKPFAKLEGTYVSPIGAMCGPCCRQTGGAAPEPVPFDDVLPRAFPPADDSAADQPIPEDADIAAALTASSGATGTYAEARRLVWAKRSKAALVQLVNWLLADRNIARTYAASLKEQINTWGERHKGATCRAGDHERLAEVERLRGEVARLKVEACRTDAERVWKEHTDKLRSDLEREIARLEAKIDAPAEPAAPSRFVEAATAVATIFGASRGRVVSDQLENALRQLYVEHEERLHPLLSLAWPPSKSDVGEWNARKALREHLPNLSAIELLWGAHDVASKTNQEKLAGRLSSLLEELGARR